MHDALAHISIKRAADLKASTNKASENNNKGTNDPDTIITIKLGKIGMWWGVFQKHFGALHLTVKK